MYFAVFLFLHRLKQINSQFLYPFVLPIATKPFLPSYLPYPPSRSLFFFSSSYRLLLPLLPLVPLSSVVVIVSI